MKYTHIKYQYDWKFPTASSRFFFKYEIPVIEPNSKEKESVRMTNWRLRKRKQFLGDAVKWKFCSNEFLSLCIASNKCHHFLTLALSRRIFQSNILRFLVNFYFLFLFLLRFFSVIHGFMSRQLYKVRSSKLPIVLKHLNISSDWSLTAATQTRSINVAMPSVWHYQDPKRAQCNECGQLLQMKYVNKK